MRNSGGQILNTAANGQQRFSKTDHEKRIDKTKQT